MAIESEIIGNIGDIFEIFREDCKLKNVNKRINKVKEDSIKRKENEGKK